jgi:hypothetical protein
MESDKKYYFMGNIELDGIKDEINKLKLMLEDADRITKRSLRLGYIAIILGAVAVIISVIIFSNYLMDSLKNKNYLFLVVLDRTTNPQSKVMIMINR